MKKTLLLFCWGLFTIGVFAGQTQASLFEVKAMRNYKGVVEYLDNIVKTYGQNAQEFVLGDSDSGQKIIGVKVGNGPVNNLVVATHHGNEYGSTEVALRFAYTVAVKPIAGQTIWVVPVLNIGGYNAGRREEMSSTRGKSYDPNRNYPSPCGTEGPFTLKSTAALARFIVEKNIVASATLHTFYPAVTYPWGLSTKDLTTGYESIFKGLVQTAAADSHYKTGNTTDLIYAANGSFEDYAFMQQGIWSLLFELGSTHNPSPKQVEDMIAVNVPGLRRMMESAPAQRADKHSFTGTCDRSRGRADRHDE
ncbi:MAG: carboxypeptidase [Bdellovibrionales bacterium]|nr:carboxypeptidase [Bdellovibrionales bacterium]